MKNQAYKTIFAIWIAIASIPGLTAELNIGFANLSALKAGESGTLTASMSLTGAINPKLYYELSITDFTVNDIAFNQKNITGISLDSSQKQTNAVANFLQFSTASGPLQPSSVTGSCQWNPNQQAVQIQSLGPCHIIFTGTELSRLQHEGNPKFTMLIFAKTLVYNAHVHAEFNYNFSPLLIK